jgi:hypothetical protein
MGFRRQQRLLSRINPSFRKTFLDSSSRALAPLLIGPMDINVICRNDDMARSKHWDCTIDEVINNETDGFRTIRRHCQVNSIISLSPLLNSFDR